jgi:hypothetical protein
MVHGSLEAMAFACANETDHVLGLKALDVIARAEGPGTLSPIFSEA